MGSINGVESLGVEAGDNLRRKGRKSGTKNKRKRTCEKVHFPTESVCVSNHALTLQTPS